MGIGKIQRRATARAGRQARTGRLMNPMGNPSLRHLLLLLLAALAMVVGTAARAQSDPPPLKPEEIEALVAPIALYPDSLLTQVLMASTYPLEVVQAARWQKANPKLKGDEAVKAVANQPWDVSVKSMVAFPQILEPMDQKIDWTQKLGDAFLADQKAVLDAVQRLRAKAQASGNLKSTEQQKVQTQTQAAQQVIIIEPADPQVIYVPSYNPTVVYGAWGYPAYPPYYWPPSPFYYPTPYYGAGIAWGAAWGFAAGAIYGNANWGGGDVNIDIDRATNIDRNFNRNNVSGGKWQHDAGHRQGVSYRDSSSRQKYGQGAAGAGGRQDYRGRDSGAGVADRAGDRPGDRAGDRAGDRPGDRGGAGSVDRGGAGVGDRGGASVADRGGSYGGGGRDNAFSGVGNASASQRDFSRGQASAGSMSSNRGGYSGGAAASRPSPSARPSGGGGGARGGGGGGGRGGGRR